MENESGDAVECETLACLFDVIGHHFILKIHKSELLLDPVAVFELSMVLNTYIIHQHHCVYFTFSHTSSVKNDLRNCQLLTL